MKKKFAYILVAIVLMVGLYIVVKRPPQQEQFPTPRPVQTMIIAGSANSNIVVLTGEVRAENEAGIGFRIDGKMIERLASLGDTIKPGQVVARLDPQDMNNNLVSAKADLAAAQAALTEATSNEYRQRTLYDQGVAPQMRFEEAQKNLGVARARVTAAKAHVKLAEDQLGYTNLKSDVVGAVTETLAEAGEVVRAGQVILRVAQDGGRDAIFNVPEGLMQARTGESHDLKIDIALSHDPNVHVKGYIREISPQADPVTRTFTVKIGLIDPPPEVRLGSVVTGRAVLDSKTTTIRIPSMALNRQAGKPAVWVVDPAGKVSLRDITIGKYDQKDVIVTDGLQEGDVIVTAGVHSLQPNQIVRTASFKPEILEPAGSAGQ